MAQDPTCAWWRRAAATLVVLALALPASAQQPSRAGERERQQAERAKRLKPSVKNKGERAAEIAERYLAGSPQGIYPWFGSVTGGGWLALGAGYQKRFADSGTVNVVGGWSLRNYKLLRSSLTLPELIGRRLVLRFDGSWMDANRMSFYGLGNDSRRESKTSFRYRPAQIGATATFTPLDRVRVGGGIEFLHVETGRGLARPSIETAFTAVDAPGLGASPTYTVGRVFAAVDWRDSPGYSRRGGLYRVEWSTYGQHDSDALSFDRVDFEALQHVPLLRENWVLVFHGLASMTDADEAREVPHFLMPYLGSSRTLRGLPNRRFRDWNLLLLSAEYRWTPSHFMDMAFFLDAGKVAPRREDLDFSGLHTSYGVGLRFHSPSAVVMRWDFAWSREGFRWMFASSQGF